jgi:hypothetical protein
MDVLKAEIAVNQPSQHKPRKLIMAVIRNKKVKNRDLTRKERIARILGWRAGKDFLNDARRYYGTDQVADEL